MDVLFGLLMIVLGTISVVFRRSLVRWQSVLFWPRAASPQVRRLREIVQLVVGLILLLFGLTFVFVFV